MDVSERSGDVLGVDQDVDERIDRIADGGPPGRASRISELLDQSAGAKAFPCSMACSAFIRSQSPRALIMPTITPRSVSCVAKVRWATTSARSSGRRATVPATRRHSGLRARRRGRGARCSPQLR